MKKIDRVVVVLVVSALIAVLDTDQVSADPDFSLFGGHAVITVTPVLLASQPSPSWGAGADKLIADALAGTIGTNTTVTDPGDYAVCSHHVGWENLVYSTSTPMWDGILNPGPPYGSEYGRVVWILVDAWSADGTDSISLDMIRVTFESSDGGVLDGTEGFIGNYTSRAIAVRADGTTVTSGPTSQKGKRLIVLVHSKLFDGGSTQAGLDQVRDWVQYQVGSSGDYRLTYTVEIIGDGETGSTATVGVARNPGSPVRPVLSLQRDGSDGSLSIGNSEVNRSYIIQSKLRLEESGWQLAGIIRGADVLTVPLNLSSRYFRAKVQ